jgi:hypothetical protein
MTAKRRARIFLLCLTLTIEACGATGETKTETYDGLSADVSALLGGLCKRMEECAGDERFFDSQLGCVHLLRSLYRCDARLESAEIEDLDSCLSALASLSCEAVLAEPFSPRACLQARASLDAELGGLAAGEACANDDSVDCREGTSCHLRDGSCGICEPEQNEGDACPGECDADLFCNDAGECEAYRVEGDNCDRAGQCHSRICTAGKCSTPHVGDDCIGDFLYCGNYLRCVEDKCAPLARIGETCNPVGEDDYPTCVYDAECINGRCVAMARCNEGGLNSPCFTSVQCAEGSSCSGIEEVCIADAAQGEPCTESGVQCADDLYCRSGSDAQGTCQKPERGEVPDPIVCE